MKMTFFTLLLYTSISLGIGTPDNPFCKETRLASERTEQLFSTDSSTEVKLRLNVSDLGADSVWFVQPFLEVATRVDGKVRIVRKPLFMVTLENREDNMGLKPLRILKNKLEKITGRQMVETRKGAQLVISLGSLVKGHGQISIDSVTIRNQGLHCGSFQCEIWTTRHLTPTLSRNQIDYMRSIFLKIDKELNEHPWSVPFYKTTAKIDMKESLNKMSTGNLVLTVDEPETSSQFFDDENSARRACGH